MSTWTPHVVSVEGRFVNASNATLLGTTDGGDRVVYKPVAGERPLWDFEPESLAVREVLTYEIDQGLGSAVVPETVLGDGIYGPGSIQRFVDLNEDFDSYDLVRGNDASLWPIVVLDVLTNNADRKLGHILQATDGRLVAIDHGLTFHPAEKLRTVLWGFAGERAPDPIVACVERLRLALQNELGDRVGALLGSRELDALVRRVEEMLRHPVHPQPPDDRPAMPWPPY